MKRVTVRVPQRFTRAGYKVKMLNVPDLLQPVFDHVITPTSWWLFDRRWLDSTDSLRIDMVRSAVECKDGIAFWCASNDFPRDREVLITHDAITALLHLIGYIDGEKLRRQYEKTGCSPRL